MKKLVLVFLFLVCFSIPAIAADVDPTNTYYAVSADKFRVAKTWTLATNQISTGDSGIAIGVDYCMGPKTLEIKTSGVTVNISTVVKEGDNAATVKTIEHSTAGTVIYSADHNINKLKIVSTITSGQIDSIILRCN